MMFQGLMLFVLAFAPLAQAQDVETDTGDLVQSGKVETPAQRDARMAWWREAKFGLFIHWGVYSVPAGFYQGKPVKGIGEWIMLRGKIPMADYQQFAKEFNPVKFDADAWVKMAKDAGMKYIIITSKHHDGFAMYPTQVNQWNIYDATPWHHDPLQELADACRKQGVKLGFYYSQAQDWNNGGGAANGNWDPAQEHDMDEYIDQTAVPQVKELLTHYGPDIPAVLWWDTPRWGMNPERAKKLDDVVQSLRPDLITNNRLGGGYLGDTETPEQHIPAQGYPGRDWEACMTMNNTWGYKSDDHNWKPTEKIIFNLCDIASKGGNYLLNVGPTSEGIIPEPSIERLAEVGIWMEVNGEAIYGTTATPFGEELGKAVEGKTGYGNKAKVSSANDWRCTSKPGKIYPILFKWPADGKFLLPGLQSKVIRAALLADGNELNFIQTPDGVTLDLPAEAPDSIASVICVEIADSVAKVAAKAK
jgi:alpha-L-fucosidase